MTQPRAARFPALFAALSLAGSAGVAHSQGMGQQTVGRSTRLGPNGEVLSTQDLPIGTMNQCLGAGPKSLTPQVPGTRTECDDARTGEVLIKQECALDNPPNCAPTYVSPRLSGVPAPVITATVNRVGPNAQPIQPPVVIRMPTIDLCVPAIPMQAQREEKPVIGICTDQNGQKLLTLACKAPDAAGNEECRGQSGEGPEHVMVFTTQALKRAQDDLSRIVAPLGYPAPQVPFTPGR